MIFHLRRRGFGISQNRAFGVDHRYAYTACLRLLGYDLRYRQVFIGVNAICKHSRFFGQGLRDLFAKRTLPLSADGNVHDQRGSCNHQDERDQQLEKNPTSH
jgi:hypothetical protein